MSCRGSRYAASETGNCAGAGPERHLRRGASGKCALSGGKLHAHARWLPYSTPRFHRKKSRVAAADAATFIAERIGVRLAVPHITMLGLPPQAEATPDPSGFRVASRQLCSTINQQLLVLRLVVVNAVDLLNFCHTTTASSQALNLSTQHHSSPLLRYYLEQSIFLAC